MTDNEFESVKKILSEHFDQDINIYLNIDMPGDAIVTVCVGGKKRFQFLMDEDAYNEIDAHLFYKEMKEDIQSVIDADQS